MLPEEPQDPELKQIFEHFLKSETLEPMEALWIGVLIDRIAKYKKALEFYAYRKHLGPGDIENGFIARRALEN